VQRKQMPIYVFAVAAGIVVLIVSGVRFATLAPFLVLLACPLMMVVMMRGMSTVGRPDHHRGSVRRNPSDEDRAEDRER
jgi:hypothetical protein